MKAALIIVGALVVLGLIVGFVVFGWYTSTYDQIIKLNNACEQQGGNVDAVMQRRYDLIPNLVASVKGIFKQEQAVLIGVTEARAKVGQVRIDLKDAKVTPEQAQQYMQAQDNLGSALSRLLVVMEKYPEIKSDKQVAQLMDELAGTENRISVERTRYNEKVADYNNKIQSFFGSFVANRMNMKTRARFEMDAAAKTAPKVEL